MSVLNKATGITVVKAAQALPQTATATLFTVTGGPILVQRIVGKVTTATGATVTNLSLGYTPTGGANVPAGLCTAAAITSLAVGKLFVVAPFTTGTTPVAPFIGGAVQMPDPQLPVVVPDGVITWTTSASDTGAMAWWLTFIPLDPASAVS
jgi:hypothetical protein